MARRLGMHRMFSLSQLFLMMVSVQRGLGGGRKIPSGALNIFFRAEDSDVRLDFVVIRREIFVTERPVVASAIVRADFEVHRRHAERDPAPVVGTSANDARTEPEEF